jgi:hypothetical protein
MKYEVFISYYYSSFFILHSSFEIGRAASRGLRPRSRRAIRSITFAPSGKPSVATVVPLLSLSQKRHKVQI